MAGSLVILAAGLGSRFGGDKQFTPVGPHDATIMDYTIYDALRAGLAHVAFIVRPDLSDDARARLASRYEQHARVEFVEQRVDDLPAAFAVNAERTKPWGTGQAVWSVRNAVTEPFLIVNADDFYGSNAIQRMAAFLRETSAAAAPTLGLAAYRLRDTLPPRGTVNRALCRRGADGRLNEIAEIVGIARTADDGVYEAADGRSVTLAGDTEVSMNLWAATPALFDLLEARFSAFLADHVHEAKAEFYLPAAVQDGMRDGVVRVELIPAESQWCGVTHPDDLPSVREHVAKLVANGVYPEVLWA